MFARNRVRYWATFCLINLVVLPQPASSTEPPANELVVYLLTDAAQSQRPLDQMKLELGRLMGTGGYRIEWRDARGRARDTTSSPLVFIELRDVCGNPAASSTEAIGTKPASFATTAVSEGRVLPFSSINCANLSLTLAAPLAAEAGARRDFLLGRSMARVLAHELYHILVRTVDHAHEGIARASFTVADLLAERFEFEQATLARLRRQPEPIASGVFGVVSGR